MVTFQQLIKKKRKIKTHKEKNKALLGCPQKKGICIRVKTMTPRKPNSATRKIARVKLTNNQTITTYIPGEGHHLQTHSAVLVKGGGPKDLPGVRYRLIRGKFDLSGVKNRKKSRSKYGTKRK